MNIFLNNSNLFNTKFKILFIILTYYNKILFKFIIICIYYHKQRLLAGDDLCYQSYINDA